MNEINLLAALRDELPPASDGVLADARAQLTGAAAPVVTLAERRPAKHLWRHAAVGIAAAAVLATGAGMLVATHGPGSPVGGASAQANAGPAPAIAATPPMTDVAKILHRAIAANTDPVVGPGQYLKVRTRDVNGTYVAYVPADRTQTWLWHDHYVANSGRPAWEDDWNGKDGVQENELYPYSVTAAQQAVMRGGPGSAPDPIGPGD